MKSVFGFIPLAVALTCVIATRSVAQTCAAQSADSRYYNMTFPGAAPSYTAFCGPTVTRKVNGYPNLNSAMPGDLDSDGIFACYSNHEITNGRIKALHKAEIRGWVQSPPYSKSMDGGDQEYKFYVVLDVGWLPDCAAAAAGVHPINTLALVAPYITPNNIINFGGRSLSNSTFAWGGLGTAIIHVEIDAWGSARTVGDQRTSEDLALGYTNAGYSTYYYSNPSGWTYQGYNFPAFWAFNPGIDLVGANYVTPLSTYQDDPRPISGDYVRLVGTLWTDYSHKDAAQDWYGLGCQSYPYSPFPGMDAKNCWWGASGASIGWTEMHSADYMTTLPPPSGPGATAASASHTPHTLAAYAMCDSNPFHGPEGIHELLVPVKPFPNSVISSINEVWDSLSTPSSLVIPSSGRTAQVASASSARIDLDAASIATPVFKAVYDIGWTCTATSCQNRCNDGCGGTCSPCAAGLSCDSNGACHAPPPPPPPPTCGSGQKLCGDVCIGRSAICQ